MAGNVLLTGASSGIGLETARLLTAHGFEVWGTARSVDRLPQLPRFHPIALDLTNPDSIHTAFATAWQQAQHFDILINNAGSGWFGPVANAPAEIMRDQFATLFFGPLELIHLVLPAMRRRQRGLIINVTSLAAIFPIPGLAPYSTAKAALSSLTTTLRVELADTRIRFIELQPGDIHTPFHELTPRLDPSHLDEPDRARFAALWDNYQHAVTIAPPSRLVADAILRVIENPDSPPIVRAGTAFQAVLAPLAARFAPRRLVEWALRRYYGL